MSWQWIMTQKLKRNWLVISKLTWGIWRIFTWALESLKHFHFNELLLIKVYIVWAKNVQREDLSSMKLKMDTKFGEESTCRFKIDIRNLTNFTWALKSLKDFHFNGLFLRKVYTVWAKKSTEELSFMTWKSDAEFEQKLTCCLQNDIRNLANFHQSTWKCRKFMRSYVLRQWRMIQKLKRNWLVLLKLTWETWQIFTRALQDLKHLCFNWLLVTKVYIAWATKVQGSYLSWH